MKSRGVKIYKSLLRNKLRLSIDRISARRKRKKSGIIIEKLVRTSYFKRAHRILAYAALPAEVQTRKLVDQSLRLEKEIYLPWIGRRSKSLQFYRIQNWKRDLRKGTYGILEPRALKSRQGRMKDLDLIIVPGLGFDRKGRRLGRGGGFYDRFLAKAGRVKKIGLAFREQIVKTIPFGPNDIHMNKVITD